MVFIVIVVGSLIFLSSSLFLGKNTFNLFGKSVKGISTQRQNNASLPSASSLQNSLQQKLVDIQQHVSKLNIADIASSSPQVQKLIKDLNALKDYPSNQIKDVCQKICSGL